MRVRVNQSRKNVLAAQIDGLETDRAGPDRLDASVADRDGRVRGDTAVADVHDIRVDEHERPGIGSALT
jgi:hypothetical protein